MPDAPDPADRHEDVLGSARRRPTLGKSQISAKASAADPKPQGAARKPLSAATPKSRPPRVPASPAVQPPRDEPTRSPEPAPVRRAKPRSRDLSGFVGRRSLKQIVTKVEMAEYTAFVEAINQMPDYFGAQMRYSEVLRAMTRLVVDASEHVDKLPQARSFRSHPPNGDQEGQDMHDRCVAVFLSRLFSVAPGHTDSDADAWAEARADEY